MGSSAGYEDSCLRGPGLGVRGEMRGVHLDDAAAIFQFNSFGLLRKCYVTPTGSTEKMLKAETTFPWQILCVAFLVSPIEEV